MLEYFQLIRTENQESKSIEILKKSLFYIYSTREEESEQIAKLLKQSGIGEYEGLNMTTAERLKKEGQKEAKLETARKMKEKGMDLATIIEITGLSEEELRENGILN